MIGPVRTGVTLLFAGTILCSATGSGAQGAPVSEVSAQSVAAAIGALDDMVAEALERSGVPGLALAVVYGGEVVHTKGHGLRELGKADPVTPQTVFQIASLSKPVAATVIATQVTNGIVDWTSPVKPMLPWMALSDPWVEEHVTVGDLFSHRSGLPDHAGDDLEDLGYDRATVLQRLAQMPLDPFRVTYAYTNFGLTLAAEAVATAAGTDWASLSEEALYAPLGMASTSSRFEDFRDNPNRATGHTIIDGAFVPWLFRNPDPQSPAGGVSSTVEDFARWMNMVLAEGDVGTPPLIEPGALLPAITPEIVSSPARSSGALPGFYGYGFGVGIRPTGETSLSHSGAFMLGAATSFMLLPAEDLGIVVFTNAAPVGVAETIAYQFMDLAQYGEYQRDWASIMTSGFKAFAEPVGSLAGRSPPSAPEPAANLEAYAGTYGNLYLGEVSVEAVENGLALRLSPYLDPIPLEHWDGDSFVFPIFNENMPDGSVSEVIFDPVTGGKSPSVTIEYLNERGLGTLMRAG